MAKPKTFPTIIDHSTQLRVSALRKFGLLKEGQCIKGTLMMGRTELTVIGNLLDPPYSVILIYQYGNRSMGYTINLEQMYSNLNGSRYYHFICPVSKKRCRVLYLIRGVFVHREAFGGCMYEIQTYSKNDREAWKLIEPSNKFDKLYKQSLKPYYKPRYNGRQTRRDKKLTMVSAKAAKITEQDIIRALLK